MILSYCLSILIVLNTNFKIILKEERMIRKDNLGVNQLDLENSDGLANSAILIDASPKLNNRQSYGPLQKEIAQSIMPKLQIKKLTDR